MKPVTFDKRRLVLGGFLDGAWHDGLYEAEQLRPVRRRAVAGIRTVAARRPFSTALAHDLRHEVAGVAPRLFLGPPDPHPEFPSTMAVIEARPEGVTLADAGTLQRPEVVRLGLGLCDTILACGPEGKPIDGLRPETVFVAGEAGQRRFGGATPRVFIVLGNSGLAAAFPHDPYRAPESHECEPHALLYSVALLLWFAATGSHAFGSRSPESNMWADRREPFTGPPELGRLLEAVLVADPSKRMTTAELRAGLADLARAWSVELPPFPPPGLAEP